MLCPRLAVTLAMMLVCAPASAAPLVGGNLKSADLEVRDCPITEVLDALTHRFDFHYRSRADLTGSVTGRYEGSVPQIIRRVLHGYSFVIRSDSKGIDLTVIGAEMPPVNEPENPRRRRRSAD